MDSAEWQRVKGIVDGALDEPPAGRPAFLERACGHDDALRAEVESLLGEAERDPESCTIERHVARGTFGLGPQMVAAGRIGPYAIVRELGHGGMGAVYLAHRADGQFHHEVALKVMRHASMQADLEPQFRRERQILAGLNHPHIARLLDGGIGEGGEPYLVMEYVEGEPLLTFASRRGLTVRERVQIILGVCDAVAYAHAQLVVHRDIKPSNILVTPAGSPKLVDFGLAKILDEAIGRDPDQTVGVRAFTPSYSAPEHVLGRPATTIADVYATGVVLYELLAGAKPFDFDGRSVGDILHTLETSRPERPSDVRHRTQPESARELRGDLDNIALRAIEYDPDRRYPTIRDLAADLERYLAGRPVLARTPTTAYKVQKFVSRHRAGVAASTLMGAGLIAAFVVALWQAGVARAERDHAMRRFDEVRRMSNDLLFELAPRIERLHGATEARQVLLQRALLYLDSLAAEADEPGLRRELATAYEKIGDLQGNPTNPNLVELDAAISSYRKAQDLRRRLLADFPVSRDRRQDLAENQRVLGTVYAQANDFERSTLELTKAVDALTQLAGEVPSDTRLRTRLARAIHDVGRNESNTSRYAGAVPHFERAIDIADEALRREPGALDAMTVLGDSHAQLGLALSWERRQKEAEGHMAEAATIYETAVRDHPDEVTLSSGLWSAYWLTSSVFEDQDDVRAHAFSLRALELARETTARDPADVRARQQLARSLSRAGQMATIIGRPTEALRHLEESSSLWRDVVANETRNGRLRSELALTLTRLAEAQTGGGLLAGALGNAEEAERVFETLAAESPDDKRSARNHVLTLELIGDIHVRMASSGTGPRSPSLTTAAASYTQALDLLARLDQKGSLAAADREYMEELRRKAGSLAAPGRH